MKFKTLKARREAILNATKYANHTRLNTFQMRSYCSSDKSSAVVMACHNIGAGGVNVFCSTHENVISVKRAEQRNKRKLRATGTRL